VTSVINVAIDTNVLVYAEDRGDKEKCAAAIELLETLPGETTLIPVLALGELYRVLVAKGGRSPAKAHQAVIRWGDTFPLIELSSDVLLAAVELTAAHRLFIWDAVMLASAADAGCRLLLSEDFQDGFFWNGVTVTNPFSETRHLLLDALLNKS
jgi:predicted nucleic acid-binding protein